VVPGRVGLGVSPASPGARATPPPGATPRKFFFLYYTLKKKKNYTYTSGEKKKIIHKIKFLIEGKKNILRG
jgi:hypothetical protein